ncbi:MAG: ThiF family adenylyltransferase [Aeromicrobium sp.]
MSTTLVGLSPDLLQLLEDGYDIEVRDGNLLVHHVPFVNSEGDVVHGIVVSELSTDGERTIQPGRHEVWIVGDVPHDHLGNKISIIADEEPFDYGGGLVACCRLSGKPGGQMPRDYHHKITNYVSVLGRFARAVDASATHLDFPLRETSAEESVFRYHDAATSRSGLSAVTEKLKGGRLAIVGLGGTGSYILDLVAKTPVSEIHLFDDDVLFAHNAFRAPGAASLEELRESPLKVDYLATTYDAMHRAVTPHPVRLNEATLHELDAMDFVFLSMDAGPEKKVIIEHLQSRGTSFVDAGMGVQRMGNSLRGKLRVTAGTPDHYDHIPRRVAYADVNANEYDWNIQTADLNMMNAAMAVLKWKKTVGYYVDSKNELNSTYTVATNQLVSGDLAE